MDSTDRPNAGQQANSARDSTTPPAGCINPDRIAPAVADDPRWYGFRWNGKCAPPTYFHFPSADEVTLESGEPVAIIPARGNGSPLDVAHAALLDGAKLDGIAMLAPGAKRPELFNNRDGWILWTKESIATEQEKIALLDALGCYDDETRALLIEHGILPKPPASHGHDTEPSTQAPMDPDSWPRLEPEDKPPHLCTDQANGYRIARHLGHDLLYVVRIGWHSWRETHWRLGEEFAYRKAQKLSRLILEEAATITKKSAETEESERRKKLMEIAEALTKWAAKSESCGTVYSAMTLAKPLLTIEYSELDRDHWLLNCVNGTLDLRAGTLRPPRRADFITRCIPVAYDPQATCPTWLTFLERIFSSNREMIHFVQKAIGYTLTADTSEQCVFFLWGGGQNGKSTLLSTVQAMMGAYAQQAAPDLLVVSKHERHTTEIAELRGARLVASIETGDGRRLNEPLIKQMSGGDRMKGRFMRQDNIEFDPTHKVFLATNHKPVIRGADYAIWRRIRLIPFTVTIPPEERDLKLVDKLKAELPGILAWAVHGCLAWQQEGLAPPKDVIEATDQYKAESDVLAAFLGDYCVIHDGARVKAAELYNAFRQWCEQNGERITETQTSFGLRMAERGFEKRKVATGLVYVGIGLQTDGYEEGEL